jgi:hypothetical protein
MPMNSAPTLDNSNSSPRTDFIVVPPSGLPCPRPLSHASTVAKK